MQDANGNVKRREMIEELDRLEKRSHDAIMELASKVDSLIDAQKASERQRDENKSATLRWAGTIALSAAVVVSGFFWFAMEAAVAPISERQKASREARENLDREHRERLGDSNARLIDHLTEIRRQLEEIDGTAQAAHEKTIAHEVRLAEHSRRNDDLRSLLLSGGDARAGAVGVELRTISDELKKLWDRLELQDVRIRNNERKRQQE